MVNKTKSLPSLVFYCSRKDSLQKQSNRHLIYVSCLKLNEESKFFCSFSKGQNEEATVLARWILGR